LIQSTVFNSSCLLFKMTHRTLSEQGLHRQASVSRSTNGSSRLNKMLEAGFKKWTFGLIRNNTPKSKALVYIVCGNQDYHFISTTVVDRTLFEVETKTKAIQDSLHKHLHVYLGKIKTTLCKISCTKHSMDRKNAWPLSSDLSCGRTLIM
jgi:hypothetical protein